MWKPPSFEVPACDSGSNPNPITMLSYTITFLVIALIAGVLGFAGIAGTAAYIAKICFFIFAVLFVVSLVTGRKAA